MVGFFAPLSCLALVGTVGAQGNVLLVVLDDVGVDRVAAYEAVDDPPATPVLDRLIREGVRFDRCWSNPLCSPTRATLLTGRYGFRTGVGSLLGEQDTGLSTEEWTLPRVLRAATDDAYYTAAIGKWHLGASDEDLEHPRRAGFGHYAGCLNNLRNSEDPRAYYHWTKVIDGKAHEAEGYLTTDTADDALRAIAAAGGRPWFVYLAFHAAHNPLHQPPTTLFDREPEDPPLQHPAELHKAMVEALDHELGRLLEGVDPEVLARTTILVVGDNGTQGAANEPPWDHRRGKGTLFEGGIHVPLIVAGARVGERARGSVCAAPVNTSDLFATTLELCGVDVDAALPAGWVHDSVSILPHLEDPDATPRRDFLFAEQFLPNHPTGRYEFRMAAMRVGRYKLIRNLLDGTERLYDLGRGPLEKRNLLRLKELPDEAAAAHEELGRKLDSLMAE